MMRTRTQLPVVPETSVAAKVEGRVKVTAPLAVNAFVASENPLATGVTGPLGVVIPRSNHWLPFQTSHSSFKSEDAATVKPEVNCTFSVMLAPGVVKAWPWERYNVSLNT